MWGPRTSRLNRAGFGGGSGLSWVRWSRPAGVMPLSSADGWSRTRPGSACQGRSGDAGGGRSRGTRRWRWPARPSSAALAVEELDLHAAPERLDDRVVVAVAHGSHRGQQARVNRPAGKGPRRQLRALVGVDHGPLGGATLPDGHAERVGDQGGRRRGVDGPADDPSGEGVEDDSALDLAFPGWVLGDVGDPQTVGPAATGDRANAEESSPPP